MRSKAFFIFLSLIQIILGPPPLLADPIDGLDSRPFVTNSNEKAIAYFQLTKTSGAKEIIKVPPSSRMYLPADVVEFQYLYMEGEENTQALSDLSTIVLTEPDSDVVANTESSLEIENVPLKIEDAPFEEAQAKVAFEDLEKEERAKAEEEALRAMEQADSVRMINEGEKTVIARVLTRSKEQFTIVLGGREFVTLPKESEFVELLSRKTRQSQSQDQPFVRIEKPAQKALKITQFDRQVSIRG